MNFEMDTPHQDTRISSKESNFWLWKIARWLSLRRFGKVITPLKVIYSRVPSLLIIAALIDRVREKQLHLNPELRFLILVRTSQMNQCSFCNDLIKAQAIRAKLGPEKFAALQEWETSEAFSKQERLILAATDELCQTHDLKDTTFTALKEQFSEREIIEIIWLCASETYFNIMAHSLRIGSDRLFETTKSQS
jgi:AhpD family alkylhydroperoxidase